MARWMKALLLFVVALALTALGSWLMNPVNTPFHGWLAPSLGEEGVRLLRYAAVGLATGLAAYLIEAAALSHRGRHGA